jgi:hypothetical protein
MKRIALYTLILTAAASAQDVTPAEREHAQRYLSETRKSVEDAVKGLTEAQWKFRPASDRWSIAEVVEHLALIEDAVDGILGKIPQAPASAADRDAKQVDAKVVSQVLDRSNKVQAPEGALPTGSWTPAGALDHYLAARARTAELLTSTSGLRAHVIVHPYFGPLDGYQWVLAVAAHSVRHTQQILEVKASMDGVH